MRKLLVVVLALLPACNARMLDDRRTPPDPAEAKPTGADEVPGRTCTPAGETPTLLADRAGLRPLSLVPDGDKLWFVNDETPPPSDMDPYPRRVVGAWSVAVSGGSPRRSEIKGFEGSLTTFEGQLAYVRGDLGEADRAIVLRDHATGLERIVRSIVNESVSVLVSQPSGLYWAINARTDDYRSTLFRFAGGRASELVSGGPPSLGSFVTDATDAYYLRWHETDEERSELRLESVPVAGGEPRVVYRFGDDPRFMWSLIGVTADEIFVTMRARQPEQSSIRAIPKDGSRQRVVVQVPGFGSEPVLEGDDLTWIDGDHGRSILQANRAGGAITRFGTSDDGRRIGTIVVDRCNVYWTALAERRSDDGGSHRDAAIYGRTRASR